LSFFFHFNFIIVRFDVSTSNKQQKYFKGIFIFQSVLSNRDGEQKKFDYSYASQQNERIFFSGLFVAYSLLTMYVQKIKQAAQ